MPQVALGETEKLRKYRLQCLHYDDYQFVLIRHQEQFFLLDNLCPHKAAALCEGELTGDTIACPWHEAIFDIRSGAGLSPLAGKGVRAYQVSEVDGQLMVDLP